WSAEYRLSHRADGERLSGAGAGDDAESFAGARELANLCAVFALEERLQVQTDRDLDRLARRTRGRNDDDAPRRRLGRNERVVIRRKPVVERPAELRRITCHERSLWHARRRGKLGLVNPDA